MAEGYISELKVLYKKLDEARGSNYEPSSLLNTEDWALHFHLMNCGHPDEGRLWLYSNSTPMGPDFNSILFRIKRIFDNLLHLEICTNEKISADEYEWEGLQHIFLGYREYRYLRAKARTELSETELTLDNSSWVCSRRASALTAQGLTTTISLTTLSSIVDSCGGKLSRFASISGLDGLSLYFFQSLQKQPVGTSIAFIMLLIGAPIATLTFVAILFFTRLIVDKYRLNVG